jgi:hypothetical protein
MLLPTQLEELIDYRWPDSLWVSAEKHSETCYTIWVLDIDYSYNEARATFSLAERWTLSPVRGPWHTAETGSLQERFTWERTDRPRRLPSQ